MDGAQNRMNFEKVIIGNTFPFFTYPPPPPPSTPHLSYPAPLNLSFWHHYALRAQSEEAAHKKINKGNSESFAPFMPFRFQFLLFLRLLCATLFLLVLSPISVRFRVVFVSHFHNMQSFNGELENFPTANQIDAVLPIVVTTVVYFRCCRHECRKDRYIYIYIHSHGIPRVLFDGTFNMHLSIENSLYSPFIVIYTDVGTSHCTIYSNQLSE